MIMKEYIVHVQGRVEMDVAASSEEEAKNKALKLALQIKPWRFEEFEVVEVEEYDG